MKYISRILFVLAVMLCGAGTAQADTDDLSIVTTGVSGASVTAYVSDSEPSASYTATGAAATVVQHGQYLVLKVTPDDGKWLNNEMLEVQVAGGPGGALGRTRSGMMVAEHPTALSSNQDNGTGYYYYQIPSGCTAANGYKNVVVTGASIGKIDLNSASIGSTGKVITKTTDGWTVTITLDEVSWKYDASAHCPAITGFSLTNGTKTFTNTAAQVDISGANTNVGNYNATLFAVDGGCFLNSKSVPYVIGKTDLTITANDQVYVYNGSPQGEDDIAYTSGFDTKVSVDGLKGSDKLTSITLDGSATYVSEYSDKIEPKEAEVGESTGNYTITYVKGKLTITQKEVGLTWTNNTPYAFSGSAQAPTVVVKDGDLVAGDACTVNVTIEAKEGSSLTNGEAVNAGSYTAKVTGLSNINNSYKLSDNAVKAADFTIISNSSDAVVVTIEGHSLTTVYDGAEHSVSGYDVKSISNPLCSASDFSFNGTAEPSASRTDAGTTNMGLTAESFTNNNQNFGSVTFQVTDGFVKINPKGVNPNPDPSSGEGKISITVSPATAEYDGTDKKSSISVTVKDGEGDAAVTIPESEYDVIFKKDGSEVSSLIDVADYTIVIQNKAGKTNGNYDVNGTATFKITPKEVGLTWTNKTPYTFNGSAQAPTVVVKDGDLVTGDACTVNVTIDAKEGSSLTNSEAVNVGNYTAKATGLSNNNYKLKDDAVKTADFEITRKGVNPNPDPSSGEGKISITVSPATAVYDGTDKKSAISVTVKDGEGDGAVTIDPGEYDVVYKNGESEVSSLIDVADYTVVIQNKAGKTNGNYDVSGTATFKITPKEVGLTWTNKTPYTFNGSAQAPTVVVKDGDLVTGDACTVNVTIDAKEGSSLTNSEAVNVGNYTAKATGLSNNNYKLKDDAVKTADFEITRKGVNPNPDPSSGEGKISITVSPATAVYDGTDKKSAISVTVKDGEGDGAVTIDPGEYDVVYKNGESEVSSLIDVADYTVVIQNKAGKTNGNYDVSGTATFKITPKEVGLTWTNKTPYTFNGSAQAPTVVVKDGDLVTGDACTVNVTIDAKEGSSLTNSEAVNVGNYTAKATGLSNNNYKLKDDAVKTADFEITRKGVNPNPDPSSGEGKISITVSPATAVYDGTDKKSAISVTVKDGEGDGAVTIDPGEYDVVYKNGESEVSSLIDVADYTVVIQNKAGKTNGNYDVNGTATFKITPKEVGLTWSTPTTFHYNAQAQQPTATVTGVVKRNGQDEACSVKTYTLSAKEGSSLTNDKAVNVGSYTATVTALDNANYKLPTNASQDFTIEQEGSFTVSFDASITSDYYVYDGIAKEPKVIVKDGDITLEKGKDYEVSYENNVNAGENTASVKVTAKGNFSGSKIEKFSIHPKEVGLTWDKTSFPYNGQAQQPKATVTGVVKLNGVDEVCTVETYTLVAKDGSSLTEGKAVNEGSYTVTATKLSNTNYKLPTEASQNFTIVQGAVTGSGIEVRRNDTKALVDNEAYLTEIDGKLRIDHVNIINPDPANGIVAGVSVYIPASLKNVDNKTGDTYGVGSDLIVTDANVPVTDVYMPETEEILNVATKAFRLVADESKTAFIHVPLPLLDDYALTPGLKAEYEAGKVVTTVKPTTQYWTFSSAVDVVVPEGLTANICSANGLKAVAITAITETTATVDGVSRILVKANNGVLMKGTANSDYDLRAWPSEERPSGLTPIPTADAKSYAGNELVPATVKTHFTPTEYYILYNETFYELKPDDNTSVSACKAVLKRTSASQARSLSIDGEGTTGIDLTPTVSEDDGVWYSIDGRKLDGKPTRKGLYIKNCQKTVIR